MMKINQVEELVGITKKNIRFYEAQGLLNPERDPENGYRDYTMRDVEQLRRVKLLRKLDVPCEQIRRLMNEELSLQACMMDQHRQLEKRGSDLEQMQKLCLELANSGSSFADLKAADLLHRMKTLEKGGVTFVDTRTSDVSKRKWGAVISALVCIGVMTMLIGLILWGNAAEPLPPLGLIFVILIPGSCIAGIVIALYQRMKELQGGEYDEASKY